MQAQSLVQVEKKQRHLTEKAVPTSKINRLCIKTTGSLNNTREKKG